MAVQRPKSNSQSEQTKEGITRIAVGGFKSIDQEQSIEIRPLTILAGANSSGKSSIMQPLLLLKQTLEAPYDPGALLLNGPNVKFTSADQLLSRTASRSTTTSFHVGIEVGGRTRVTTYFIQSKNRGFDVEQTSYDTGIRSYSLLPGMTHEQIYNVLTASMEGSSKDFLNIVAGKLDFVVAQERCFLTMTSRLKADSSLSIFSPYPTPIFPEAALGEYIHQVIHLPGLRGNPERNYPVTAVISGFPGTFEYYTASVIEQWQIDRDNDKLEKLNYDLARLGLTNKVMARRIGATQIELLVNRFLPGNRDNAEDMVSIADVGLGVSQALPVVVGLQAANKGQLLYIEQPEIHLHPRAQSAMAEVLVDAVIQGKKLVVETHSNLLLRGVQTLVAERKLPPEMVKLHWFRQRQNGLTQITSATLDETGAFGDWPEDFHTVTLQSESRYLDAAEARLRGE